MAVPTVQITGLVIAPDGTPLVSGSIAAELSHPGRAMDGAVSDWGVGKVKATITNGVIGSDFALVPNDLIVPAGTYYRVWISGDTVDKTHYQTPSSNPEKWQVASGPASIDVGAVLRIGGTPPMIYGPDPATLAARDAAAASAAEASTAGAAAGTTAGAAAAQPYADAASASATAASGSATAAAGSATAAQTARTGAETARDAANATGHVYVDTAAGLAATTEGAYFTVPAADTQASLILYRKESGAAVEKKRYPTADAALKPSWTGKKNGWPDPYFRRFDLTSQTWLGRYRWWQGSGSAFTGWTRVANPLFDGYAIRRAAASGASALSAPMIWLDELGAVAGDTITLWMLVTGSGSTWAGIYKVFDATQIDTSAGLIEGNCINDAGTNATVTSATPRWVRAEVVLPANAARATISGYVSVGATDVDVVAVWAHKGSASAGPAWPIGGEEGYQRLRDADLSTAQAQLSAPALALPPELSLVVGREFNVYFENLTPASSRDEFSWDIQTPSLSSIARQENERWTYTPGSAHAAVAITVEARDRRTGAVLASAVGTVKAAAAAAGVGQTPKAIFIGDSLTAAGTYTQEILNIAAVDDLKISLYGTRGTGSNLHEGRGGWKIADYTTDPATSKRYGFTVSGIVVAPAAGATYTHNGVTFTIDYADLTAGAGIVAAISAGGAPLASGTLTKVTGTGDATITFTASGASSPFWIGGVVDFPAYLAAKSIPVPDWAFVMLGINDCFSQTTDAGVVALAATELTKLDTLIASIKAAGVALKVGVMVPTPPSADQDAFGSNYFAGQSRDRFKRNIVIWAREVIARYTGQSANRIYLVPTNVNLDTVNNMSRAAATPVNARSAITVTRQNNGVHPSTDGYEQIADTVWSFLKCQF